MASFQFLHSFLISHVEIYLSFSQAEYVVTESDGEVRVCVDLELADAPLGCDVTVNIQTEDWNATGT